MKDDVILRVENLSKQYRLGTVGTGTISHDFNRFLARIRGKEDPFLKIGIINNRALKGNSNYVWALKDINFEVNQGEVLGIIGKNGAGKSTLLKILSKVTGPTTGRIKSMGRIASLLEVGTGFHPEMTGKENIFLNGAILGMTKKEIAVKLDEIIEFSGCILYIDTPVKRYSSGMKVRLAFAVAAFLEPDILIVDEVLAVGDAEFQKKAIGKMKDISSQGGRTVLFVSHDMAAIQSLCSKAIVLKNGSISYKGPVEKAIGFYLKNSLEVLDYNGIVEFSSKESDFYLKSISIKNIKEEITNSFSMGDEMIVSFEVNCQIKANDVKASVLIISDQGIKVAAIRSVENSEKKFNVNSNFIFEVLINDMKLTPRDYFLTISLVVGGQTIALKEECIGFTISPSNVFNTGKVPKGNFVNYSKGIWGLKKV